MVLRFEKSCVLAFLAFTVTSAVVTVQDGGYQNILVAFSPDVTKDYQSKVLSQTKDLMKSVSHAVCRATGIHFGEVVLLLPYTWCTLNNCSVAESITYSSASEVYYDANIFVENGEDTVYGMYPYTLQRGRCGAQGVRITIPKDFLDPSKTAEDEKERIIAREWIRYRYGVFYENGYPNDDIYPLYSSYPGSVNPTDIYVTGCTDKPVNYTFKNSMGQECLQPVDSFGRPSTTCTFRTLDGENNSDVSSSLMFLQDLPSVVHLCDDQVHVHNADAPNKQNSLCNGRSIWNVLESHPDFKNTQPRGCSEAPPDPNFKIVLDGHPRIILAVDRTKSINAITGKIVRIAMEKFVIDLPDQTEFSAFFFGSDVEKKLYKRQLNGNRPIQELQLVFKDETPCPSCAIRDGLQALNNENPGRQGTIVIISSTDLPDDAADLSDQLTSSQICLVVILYGSSNYSSEGFQKVSKASPCSHLWNMPIAEENTALRVLTQLSEKFEEVIRNHSYYSAMRTIETASITGTDPISFTIDQSVQDFQIRLSNMKETLDFAFDDSDVELTCGSSEKLSPLPRIQNFKLFRTYQVSNYLEKCGDKSGKWNFKLEYVNNDELLGPILLQVVSRESNSRSLRVRSWVEGTNTPEAPEMEQLPVILYVEVTMGINPVLDAKVEAVIAKPTQGTSKIYLLDNGLGDPDVTKNDGIYSRYFTQFSSKGDYQVTITISDNEGLSRTAMPPESGPSIPCCGSFIPTGAKEQTGPFKRIIKTSFEARNDYPPTGYKPSTVQDLRLLSWSGRDLTFQWTSPGNEMDTGAAKEYMFRLFQTKEDAQKNFEKSISGAFVITEPVIPQSYSNKQTAQIQLNKNLTTGKNYYFAMRSKSEKERQSDTSNVVQIFLQAPVTSTTPTNEVTKTGDDDSIRKTQTSAVDGKTIGIIVGVCVLLVIIFICAYVAFYLIIVRPKRERDRDEGSLNTRRDTSEDKGDGTEPANEWQMEDNGISPVNSWPSNVLVNHHKKVKEAKRKNEKPPVFTLDQLEVSSDEINTISNGLLPNPIYGSRAEDLNDHETQIPAPPLQDNAIVRPSRRVTHV